MKRVVIVSDLHCGHWAGLTPPAWQFHPSRNPEGSRLQAETWRWFVATIGPLRPDVLVCNGDAIDGKGQRSGSVELITADLEEQAEMAIVCLREAKAVHYMLTYGTPYHVSADGQDWEGHVARELGGTIGGHEWLECEGVVFDFKHKVGSSQIPHGRHTAVARERLWNVLWAEQDLGHRAHVLVRSHVHYHDFCGDPDFLAMTTPALQGPGSIYGVRQCSGIVHFGFIEFQCEGGRYTWTPHILRVQSARPELVKV